MEKSFAKEKERKGIPKGVRDEWTTGQRERKKMDCLRHKIDQNMSN